jgi:hypothetical protein
LKTPQLLTGMRSFMKLLILLRGNSNRIVSYCRSSLKKAVVPVLYFVSVYCAISYKVLVVIMAS